MPRFGLIALAALAPLASPAFAQSYGQSQYQQGPSPYAAPYPGAAQPYPGQAPPSYGAPYQSYPGQAPTYGQAPLGYNGAPPPSDAQGGYDQQQPRGYNQAPRTYGGDRPGNRGYSGTPGFTCNASFPFRGLEQTLVCPLGQPRPMGAPCTCPPPAGFPVGGRMPGQVIQ